MKRLILSINLKVKSWKDLTNGLQSNRQVCQKKPRIPLEFLELSNTQMHNCINLEEQRHQIKMASSKPIHFMIFFKIAYVADEFHKSQVQHNSLTMINVEDESREIFKDVSNGFQFCKHLGLQQIGIGQVH